MKKYRNKTVNILASCISKCFPSSDRFEFENLYFCVTALRRLEWCHYFQCFSE